jgi:hypothetical protein
MVIIRNERGRGIYRRESRDFVSLFELNGTREGVECHPFFTRSLDDNAAKGKGTVDRRFKEEVNIIPYAFCSWSEFLCA